MLHLGNARFIKDKAPIEKGCDCYACRTASRGYLSHLFRADEMPGPILTTIHNLTFIERLMSEIREAILNGKFEALKRRYKKLLPA